MDRPYDSIPRQGKHLGEDVHEESTTNVRAQEAAPPDADAKVREHDTKDDPAAASASGPGEVLFSRDDASGRYRIRRGRTASGAEEDDGFQELGRARDDESATSLFDQLPEGPLFVVFENMETGEVFYDRDSDLAGNWDGDGEFDQVTIFGDEEAAAEYAASRQGP